MHNRCLVPAARSSLLLALLNVVGSCFVVVGCIVVGGCRKASQNPPEPPEPVDSQHAVSSGELYNDVLLISRKCSSGPFLSVAQQVIVSENSAPGVLVVLRSDEQGPGALASYNFENARSLVALLRQQVSSSLESGPQQSCVEQFADHLGRLVTAEEAGSNH